MATVDTYAGLTLGSITVSATGYSIGNATANLYLNGGLTSNYAFTITPAVVVNAAQTWTGTGTITLSTSLTANATGATIATPIALGAAQTWTAATGDVLTVSGNISGGYGLTVNGAGTLTLTGCNTYTGTTTILAGTLLVGNAAPSGAAGALGTATLAVILGDTSGSANASLLINGAYTVGRLITVQAGSTGTLTIGSTSTTASAVFSGNISLNANVTIAQSSATGNLSITGNITNAANTNTLTFAGPGPITDSTVIGNQTAGSLQPPSPAAP